jgi:hypothetical protein
MVWLWEIGAKEEGCSIMEGQMERGHAGETAE